MKSEMDQTIWEHKPAASMIVAKRHIKEMYGDNVSPGKYTQFGKKMFIICVIGFTLIPLEIFLKEIMIS